MTYPDWREPAKLLRGRLRPVTSEQLVCAASVRLKIAKRTPSRVAAALLRDHLGDLLAEPARGISLEQSELLEELSQWERPGDVEPVTRATASAWIEVRMVRRALEYLTLSKPAEGDLVVEWRRADRLMEPADAAPERHRIVSSVGADGTVYFRGGGGRRARPHRIDVVYRADDQSDKAREARTYALGEADKRGRALRSIEGLSEVKWRRLSHWAVPARTITGHDVDALRGVIDTAEDEKPIQLFLQERLHLIATVLGGAHGRWVAPQVRLGDRYVADFFVADADSSGIRWLLVELESPRVPALLRSGEWAKETRHAMHQIEQWRHYLRENPDAARKRREDEGLGLVDIEAGVPGLVLVSRRSLVANAPEWMRRSSRLNSGVDIHTYDWLIGQVERSANMRPQLRGGS